MIKDIFGQDIILENERVLLLQKKESDFDKNKLSCICVTPEQ
jgi:hypothetical protein